MKVASQFLNVLAQFLTHYQHFCKKKKKKKKNDVAPKSEEGGDEKQLCFFFVCGLNWNSNVVQTENRLMQQNAKASNSG